MKINRKRSKAQAPAEPYPGRPFPHAELRACTLTKPGAIRHGPLNGGSGANGRRRHLARGRWSRGRGTNYPLEPRGVDLISNLNANFIGRTADANENRGQSPGNADGQRPRPSVTGLSRLDVIALSLITAGQSRSAPWMRRAKPAVICRPKIGGYLKPSLGLSLASGLTKGEPGQCGPSRHARGLRRSGGSSESGLTA